MTNPRIIIDDDSDRMVNVGTPRSRYGNRTRSNDDIKIIVDTPTSSTIRSTAAQRQNVSLHPVQADPVASTNDLNFVSGIWAIVGGTPPIVRRSYTTMIDGGVMDEIANNVDPTRRFSADNIATIAGRVLRYTEDTSRIINIPGGFDNQRIIFLLQFNRYNATIDTTTTYYVNGYADKVDLSLSGHIAPDTNFYINEIVQVNSGYRKDRNGNKRRFQRMTSCDQIISGVFDPRDTTHSDHVARPMELFQHRSNDIVFNNSRVKDRVSLSSSELFTKTNKFRRSSRTNNDPSKYISKTFEALDSANRYMDETGDVNEGSFYDHAKNTSCETGLTSDHFINKISRRVDFRSNGNIPFSDLTMIWPEILDSNKFVDTTANNIGMMDSVDMTSRSLEVSIGTALVNAVSAVALDNFFTYIHFIVKPIPQRLGGGISLSGRDDDLYTVEPVQFRGYIPDELAIRKFEEFSHTLKTVTLPSIIPNPDDIWVEFEMSMVLMGKTQLDISINGDSFHPMTLPSFCDGLTAPIIVPDKDELITISNDVISVHEQIFSY